MSLLFHGSNVVVPVPDVARGRTKVDFGQGFYLTALRMQAESWARTIAGRHRNGVAVLNRYEFDEKCAREMAGERYKSFPAYDIEWLDFVVDCRRGGDACLQYDIIEGGVANDNVIDTVEDYENGVITAEQALGQLIYKKVNHQLCIRRQEILDACLHFRGHEELPQGGDHA